MCYSKHSLQTNWIKMGGHNLSPGGKNGLREYFACDDLFVYSRAFECHFISVRQVLVRDYLHAILTFLGCTGNPGLPMR